MENATKALLISAGVLISIMILSLGVYLYNMMIKYSNQTSNIIEQNAISKFNSIYLPYDGKDISIQDIISIANAANENNTSYGYYPDNIPSKDDKNNSYITVEVRGKDNIKKYEDVEINVKTRAAEWLKADLDENPIPEYTCEVFINPITSKVNKVEIKQK